MKKITFTLMLLLGFLYSGAQGYQPGGKATDFELTNVDGNTVSLGSMSDAKGYIVVFTCNSCPYSVAYEDRIIALHNQYAPKGYPVVAINSNDSLVQVRDSFSAMKQRAIEKQFGFPYLLDTDQKYANIYGATRTPHVFVLNCENNDLVVKYIGAIDNNFEFPESATEHYVSEAVEALLSGKEIITNATKAIGCSIKRKKQ